MFIGDGILPLVRHLEERSASIFHACQLKDLRSYLSLGGVPSHARLEAYRAQYTRMDTDEIDRVNDVWDKVFVNLGDFGTIFARGGFATPTAYGPITLQLHPRALLEAVDVAICLRSAGARGFDRSRESLKTLNDVSQLYRYQVGTRFPDSQELKFGDTLQAVFPEAKWPEVSCSVISGQFGIAHVVCILVDPYQIAGSSLAELVQHEMTVRNMPHKVVERSCQYERRKLYSELARLASEGVDTLEKIVARPEVSTQLYKLMQVLAERNLAYQVDRYLRYLCEGTLIPACPYYAKEFK